MLAKIRLAAFVAVTALAAFATTGGVQTVSADEAQNKKVEAIFAQFVKSGQPGGVVYVAKDGKEVYKGSFGMADIDKKTALKPTHLFEIGSLNKAMTALGIMQLSEEGKLKYDDPVGKYLPELNHFGNAMTLRRMMQHTSGITDLYDEDLLNRLLTKNEKPTNKDLLDALKTAKPAFKPGAEYAYGNVSYQMLALVIEKVSGKPYGAYLQERIFAPAGMKNSFTMPDKRRDTDPNVAHSYTMDENNKPQAYDAEDMENLYGAGSVYSTIEDLASYDNALNSGKLVKNETLAEAFKPGKLTDDSDVTYGFGWVLDSYIEGIDEMYSHPGTFLAFRSAYIKVPSQNLTVIVLFNRDYGFPDDDPMAVSMKIAEVFIKQ